MNNDLLTECKKKAIDVIFQCITPNGLFASAGKEGYDAIWARDSMISMIGASIVPLTEFKQVFKKSLITLSEAQSKSGQIPNAVDKWSKRKPHIDYQTIDSSLWYILGHYIYKKRYNDSSLFKEYNNNIKKTFFWLLCQDQAEKAMLAQLPTSDWQDAFPHRYGHTINTQSLYYKVLKLVGDKKQAKKLKMNVNLDPDKKLWNKNYYLAYRWKNHGEYSEKSDWFDSLGNILAIVFDLANENQTLSILDYIKKNKINEHYPLRSIYPPITPKSKHWQDYFLDCDAKTPNHYSNGGIWGYIGGFYILSLIKLKQFKEAKIELEKLAKRNINGNFPEWSDPITCKHYGRLQAWEAGMYLLAYESLKKGNILL
jgi:glycogen debranching enzyme